MKQLLVVLTVGVAALVAGASAVARPVAAITGCGPKVVFLVWPHGHPAISSVQFPRIPNPHVEVYLGWGAGYPETLAGAWIVAGKPPGSIPQGGVFGPCLNYDAALASPGPVQGGIMIRTQVALRCTLAVRGVVDTVSRPNGGQTLLFHAGKRLLARADVTRSGASVTVPANACTRIAPPS
jgi:hypothetical protein